MSTCAPQPKPASPRALPTMVDRFLVGLTRRQADCVRRRLALDGLPHAAAAERLLQFAKTPERHLGALERESWDPPGASLDAIAIHLGCSRAAAGQCFRLALRKLSTPYHRHRLATELRRLDGGNRPCAPGFDGMTLAEISASGVIPPGFWKGASLRRARGPEPTTRPLPLRKLEDPSLLTTAEAAALLGLSVSCLEVRRAQGNTELPWVAVGRRNIRYRREDVEKYAAEHPRKKAKKGRRRKGAA